MAKIDTLLRMMLQAGASDLHLSPGNPPLYRINGELHRAKYHDLSDEETKTLLLEIMDEEEIAFLKAHKDIDLAYELPGEARFRGNVFMEKMGMGVAFRLIPSKICTLDDLAMPDSVRSLARLRSGLVLVTGSTGSGKSTTLAAMIDQINRERSCHIITLEDPLEFIHPKGRALIHQRQVGIHVESFTNGLRAALREDPDVVLVGEMRDLQTIHLALTAAETGLLVLGTLHTQSAAKTVDRIIDAFPVEQQSQTRTMLSESLRGVISQQLLRRADGKGRVAAIGVLVSTSAVRNLIREGKTYQINSIMQTGSMYGMQTMESHVLQLVQQQIVSAEEAAACGAVKENVR